MVERGVKAPGNLAVPHSSIWPCLTPAPNILTELQRQRERCKAARLAPWRHWKVGCVNGLYPDLWLFSQGKMVINYA